MTHPIIPKSEQIQRICAFIRSIAINVEEGPVDSRSFLPGVEIVRGALVYDEQVLAFPGDLLHEAGHIALIPAGLRSQASGDVAASGVTDGGEEMAVMLWTYAACRFMGIAPEIVFHSGGYKGDSEWLLDNYTAGTYIGLPLLQWMGLCARDGDGPGFPRMLKWVRD